MYVAEIGYPFPNGASKELVYRWQGSYCYGVENYVQSLRNAGATDEMLHGRVVKIHSEFAHRERHWTKPVDRLCDAETLEVLK